MRKYYLVRLGPCPDPNVNYLLARHVEGQIAVCCQMPGVILTVFNSKSTIEEIRKELAPTGYWFFIGEQGKDFGFQLPSDLVQHIEKTFAKNRVECTLSLDDLLELVEANGLESLTQPERERLNELSKK